MDKKRINIFMVEDNAADAFLTRETLSESTVNDYDVSTSRNGIEALAFLRRKKGDENAAQPDLIILDLSLPRMDGFEFLTEMRKDKELVDIPVFVLTTSAVRVDAEKARELGVISYLIKPIDLSEFESALSNR